MRICHFFKLKLTCASFQTPIPYLDCTLPSLLCVLWIVLIFKNNRINQLLRTGFISGSMPVGLLSWFIWSYFYLMKFLGPISFINYWYSNFRTQIFQWRFITLFISTKNLQKSLQTKISRNATTWYRLSSIDNASITLGGMYNISPSFKTQSTYSASANRGNSSKFGFSASTFLLLFFLYLFYTPDLCCTTSFVREDIHSWSI